MHFPANVDQGAQVSKIAVFGGHHILVTGSLAGQPKQKQRLLSPVDTKSFRPVAWSANLNNGKGYCPLSLLFTKHQESYPGPWQCCHHILIFRRALQASPSEKFHGTFAKIILQIMQKF